MFSIDTTGLMTTASSIFNALWPAFAIIVGLALGFGILKVIVSEIQKAF
jgi:hypothetical protein